MRDTGNDCSTTVQLSPNDNNPMVNYTNVFDWSYKNCFTSQGAGFCRLTLALLNKRMICKSVYMEKIFFSYI